VLPTAADVETFYHAALQDVSKTRLLAQQIVGSKCETAGYRRSAGQCRWHKIQN
jgi:hypothetical protein